MTGAVAYLVAFVSIGFKFAFAIVLGALPWHSAPASRGTVLLMSIAGGVCHQHLTLLPMKRPILSTSGSARVVRLGAPAWPRKGDAPWPRTLPADPTRRHHPASACATIRVQPDVTANELTLVEGQHRAREMRANESKLNNAHIVVAHTPRIRRDIIMPIRSTRHEAYCQAWQRASRHQPPNASPT